MRGNDHIDMRQTLLQQRSFRGGDANKDGLVNLADFNILAANFGDTGATWTEADFNGDGTVNLSDFNVLAGNFGQAGVAGGPAPQAWATLSAAVPEPGSVGAIITLGATVLTLRRRRAARSLNV